jgi:DNA-binding NarL/FixJ family response regulator
MRKVREGDTTIAIVDDEPSIRNGLERLIRSSSRCHVVSVNSRMMYSG